MLHAGLFSVQVILFYTDMVKAKTKKRGENPWDSIEGWKEVEVGDDILVGSEHYGFMGLEELDPSEVQNIQELTGVAEDKEKVRASTGSKEEMMEYIAKLEEENEKLKKQTTKKKKKKSGKEKAATASQGQDNDDDQEEENNVCVDVSAWKDFFLQEEILNALSHLGFSAPTHIQAECLPAAIRDRRDVIGAAQTVRCVFLIGDSRWICMYDGWCLCRVLARLLHLVFLC